MNHIDISAGKRTSPAWMFWTRRRFLITFLTFLGLINVYILRINMNVGIVAMNSPYNVTLNNGTVVEKQDFNWNTKMQGLALSAVYYGQLSSQVLGGWLGAKFGGRTILGLGVLMTALLTTVTPLAAYTSFYLLVAVRVAVGVFEGGIYPCIQALYAQWAPPQERARMFSFTMMGLSFGTVLGLQLSGLIGDMLGWSPIFYLTGILGLVWSAAWFLVVKNCPEDDPHISPEELNYIKDSRDDDHKNTEQLKTIKHPWGKILKSLPFWSIVMSSICCLSYGHLTILNLLPMFIKDVFKYQLMKTGFVTSVPYITMAFTMQFSGAISDWLTNKKILSTTMVRKIFVTGPFLIQAVCLVLVGHLTSIVGVIACLMLDVGLESFAITNLYVNCLELAPEHSSIIIGISSTFAALSGSVSPLMLGFIVPDHTVEQWRVLFYITSAILLLGSIFYAIFGTGKKQSWNDEEKLEKDDNLKC